MKTKGIHRAAILVKDLDKAVALYSKLLNTTFHPLAMAEESGVRAVISYDAGLEISSPIPGSNELMALVLTQHIEEHGEGLYAMVFSVDDIEKARANAEGMGIQILHKVDLDQDEVKRTFQGRYITFTEYFLNPEDTCGALVVLGQF
jgi:predicted enzyme related to lactoylglutathione lyase